MPKKSLFAAREKENQTIPPMPTSAPAPIERVERKEINNSLPPTDYIKKAPEKIIIEDDFNGGDDTDTDDWSAVPAFLRRPKK